MAFENSFFSLKGQLERIGNVGDVFKEIGSNLLKGKLLTGATVAPEYENTLIGKAAEVVSSPAFILTAPAAAGALRVAAPVISGSGALASAKTAATAAGSATLGFLGSSALRKTIGTGLLVAGGATAIKAVGDQFKSEGLQGIIRGQDPTITIPQGNNQDPIIITDPENAGVGVSFLPDQSGQIQPVFIGTGEGAPQISTAAGAVSPAVSDDKTFLDYAKDWALPAALLVGGVILFKKK